MAEKYSTEEALARLDAIEARLKAAQGKGEFKKTREKRKSPGKKALKKPLSYRGTNLNTAKQMEEINK